MNTPAQSPKGYEEASKTWEVAKLFEDLAKVKKQSITDSKKEYVCYLLLGYKSPKEIAKNLNKAEKTVRSDLSKYIYPLIKELIKVKTCIDEKDQDRDFITLLEHAGYRLNQGQNIKTNELMSEPTVKYPMENLPPAIGWIRIGAVNDTSGDLPEVGIKLIATAQPVTIAPEQVPQIGDVVSVIAYVKVRADRPKPPDFELATEIGEPLSPSTRLVILDLAAFIDLNSKGQYASYTRIWAEVGSDLSKR